MAEVNSLNAHAVAVAAAAADGAVEEDEEDDDILGMGFVWASQVLLSLRLVLIQSMAYF